MESLVEALLAEKCSCELNSQADSTPSYEAGVLYLVVLVLNFKFHELKNI